jgi:hypothetical protein
MAPQAELAGLIAETRPGATAGQTTHRLPGIGVSRLLDAQSITG